MTIIGSSSRLSQGKTGWLPNNRRETENVRRQVADGRQREMTALDLKPETFDLRQTHTYMNSRNSNNLGFSSSSSSVRNQSSKSNYFVFILLLSMIGAGITTSSCDTTDIHKPAVTYSYIFRKNAAIKLDTTQQISKKGKAAPEFHFSITSGKKLVFIYKKLVSMSKKTTDSGGSLELVFQIPEKTRNFSYRGSQLQQIQAFYRQDTREGVAVKVKDGFIRGEILSPVAWIIKINVKASGFGKPVHLKFHQPFYIKNLF
jgi:hypothetical protein